MSVNSQHSTSDSTRFSLAANYDPELIPALAPYPVDEVYGKLPDDGISGGRPRYLAHRFPKQPCGATSAGLSSTASPSI